jgi:hypothetical protein
LNLKRHKFERAIRNLYKVLAAQNFGKCIIYAPVPIFAWQIGNVPLVNTIPCFKNFMMILTIGILNQTPEIFSDIVNFKKSSPSFCLISALTFLLSFH